jgi:hypothetical protein
MKTLDQAMQTYKQQLKQGDIILAHQGLMAYIRDLRSHFEKRFPEYTVPSNIYYGYMDMTYFALMPPALKEQRLKIAVVFVYDTFRFEVWLSGANREVQVQVWDMLKENAPDMYTFSDDPRREDFVLAHVLVDDPGFSNLKTLTSQIEAGTLAFIENVEGLLA